MALGLATDIDGRLVDDNWRRCGPRLISDETDLARSQAELAEAEARYRAAQKLKGKR